MYQKSIKISGVSFNAQGKDELIRYVDEALCSRTPCRIFTPNPKMLLLAKKEPSLSALLNEASIALPDGIGISLASKMLYGKRTERISGIDFAQEILSLACSRGYSVFLLGAKPLRAEAAKENLLKKMPTLKICGCADGYFEKQGEENENIKALINSASPDILLVCFGFPAQEKWISENYASLPSVNLFMGLGGSIDVWSGQIKRAPRTIQRLGLEWLWRGLREPRRLKILFDIPMFFWLVRVQKRALRKKAKRP